MSTNQVSTGTTIDITTAGNVTSGAIYVGTDRCGVYVNTGVTGDVVPVALEGVFNVTKTTGATQAFTVGKKIYSTATGAATVTASGGTPLGHATAAAATGAATADVKLGTF